MGSLIMPSFGPVYADALIFIYSVERHPIFDRHCHQFGAIAVVP